VIVISGALVLVALVLLLIGLLQPDLVFIYASIVLSLVSFGFLIRGVLQRRGETFDQDGEANLADAPAADATPPSRDAAVGRGTTARDTNPRDTTASDARALLDAETGQDNGPTQDGAAVTTAAADIAPATLVATAAATSERDEAVAGPVLVVAGRPRYHVSGCRYITGRDVSEIAVASARVEGFTACGVCKPDLAFARNRAVAEDVPRNARPAAVDVPAEDAPGTEGLASQADAADTEIADTGPAAQPAVVEPAVVKVVPSARRATRRAAAPSAAASPVEVVEPVATSPKAVKGTLPTTLIRARKAPAPKAPAPKAPAPKAPARTAPAKKAAPVRVPATPRKATPLTDTPPTHTPLTGTRAARSAATGPTRTRATTSSAAVDPKSPATRRGSVVVIPDRGRFHLSECRFVRGVEGVQVLSRSAAARSGYQACGVCKP